MGFTHIKFYRFFVVFFFGFGFFSLLGFFGVFFVFLNSGVDDSLQGKQVTLFSCFP